MSSIIWYEACEKANATLDRIRPRLYDTSMPEFFKDRFRSLRDDVEFAERSGKMPPLDEINQLLETVEYIEASWNA